MPPIRRRPVPTPPTTRPRVAGLRKRTAPQHVVEPEPAVELPAEVPAEPTAVEPANDAQAFADPAGPAEPTEPVEPVEPEEEPAPRVAEDERADGESSARRSGWALPVALVVLAALLVGLGAWFQTRAGQVSYNRALVDSAATTEVAGVAREAVEKSFSYNFADVAATEKAAAELLTGKAQCQYSAIFEPVRALAPEQKLVVTVKVVSSGVTSLEGDRATALLFVDQVTTRTTDNQSGGGMAMMRVGARRVDDRWKIDNMEMFGQGGDRSAELAECR
ncbi:Mce-associated membrane protein [Saccharothrix coeruleofusca]|uniref:hypothetical protein n=1 Tax=Saccharothrix coeruleofusca TaxID=33919 RepID=UPI001AE15AF0|nr:hypothetical protein [Saccharothrix coeruleofusca]MBP2339414.1 Mce-associated membrane protein [Saccharothrix coeruleofusca]